MQTLVKRPDETRAFAFDFTTPAWSGGARGNTWAQPLLASIADGSTAVVSAERSDGEGDDLTYAGKAVGASQVTVRIGGGTAGVAYRVTCLLTVGSEVLAVEGNLLVLENLP